MVKSHCVLRVAGTLTIFWTTTDTLGISLTSRQMYIQNILKVTSSFFHSAFFFFFPLAEP